MYPLNPSGILVALYPANSEKPRVFGFLPVWLHHPPKNLLAPTSTENARRSGHFHQGAPALGLAFDTLKSWQPARDGLPTKRLRKVGVAWSQHEGTPKRAGFLLVSQFKHKKRCPPKKD